MIEVPWWVLVLLVLVAGSGWVAWWRMRERWRDSDMRLLARLSRISRMLRRMLREAKDP